MITLKDVENFVKKFPELELIHKDDCYGKTHHYCFMKELPDKIGRAPSELQSRI